MSTTLEKICLIWEKYLKLSYLFFCLYKSTSETLDLWNNQVTETHFQISCPSDQSDGYEINVETLYFLEVKVIQTQEKQITVFYLLLLNICPKEDKQSISMFALGPWRWIGSGMGWSDVLVDAKPNNLSPIPGREPHIYELAQESTGWVPNHYRLSLLHMYMACTSVNPLRSPRFLNMFTTLTLYTQKNFKKKYYCWTFFGKTLRFFKIQTQPLDFSSHEC